MATQDSSIPVDNEKAYNNQSMAPTKRGGKLKMLDLVFRFLTFACTLCAFIVMITNKQSKQPFLPLSPLTLWAKYHYSTALVWFVVANGIAFSYALLTLLFSAFFHTPKIARFVLILDLLVAFMIMSGASAGTTIAYLGKNGLSQSQWNPLCGTFHRYCAHVLGALFVSYLGWVNLTIAIIVGLHRRY